MNLIKRVCNYFKQLYDPDADFSWLYFGTRDLEHDVFGF